MFCIWWDQLGVVCYELLKSSETITGDRYRMQLMRLSRALKKRPHYQERHDSYPPAWQCLATCRKTGQDIVGDVEVGDLTSPAILSRRYSFRLPFVSIDGTRPGSAAFLLLRRSQKMDRFVDRLIRRIVFSRWYPTIARKMKKSNG